MKVDDVAHVRTGDKGDDLIIAVLAWKHQNFASLETGLTAERVAAHYGLPAGSVIRHPLPAASALSFHLRGVLQGGVTGSTYLDGHGKTMGYHLLSLDLFTVEDNTAEEHH